MMAMRHAEFIGEILVFDVAFNDKASLKMMCVGRHLRSWFFRRRMNWSSLGLATPV
jgi:hypothetical protein